MKRIIVDTNKGFMGLLPHRLDFVAMIKPGILEYETSDEGIVYIAMDAGMIVKAGYEVMISARNAAAGASLGKLHELVENDFLKLNETEKNMRNVLAKMESSFIQNLEKFHKR